ncbi:MAG: fhlA 2 [Bacteroidetes bacterium]|nr:fhlA 2 [Bacteroidota bacterium]
MINDIAISPNDELVVATGDGMTVIGKQTSYNIIDGLNSRFVIVLHFDRKGRLWAGTDDGLHLLQKEEGRFKVISTYFHKDGLMSSEFTRNGTMFEDDQGRIWFGAYGGLTVYDSREEPATTVKPLCYLSSLEVNDSIWSTVEGVGPRLDHTQNKLRFLFEGLTFFNEDAVRFQYYLEPLETPWSNTTNMPGVSYGYLEPGLYSFHVKAISPFGLPSDAQNLSFTILAPFWKRPWFILVGATFLILTGYLVNDYRLARVRQRNLLLEQLVTEKTSELLTSKEKIEEQYQDLLEAQKQFVEKEKLEKAYQEIQKLKDRLATENIYLKEKQTTVHEVSSIVGRSEAMRQVREKIVEVGATDSTVLITGETGTGKNLIAEAIHASSPRRDRALITVNCAAIPEGLVESELFGHEKGAFTGANERRLGKFEIADGSTIFLDEIGDMSLAIQAKLLNVLQERKFSRVGGNQPTKVDVRVIGATNHDLETFVKDARFRNDLYYRMNVFRIHIPPLRERIEDVEPLTKYFIDRSSKTLKKEINAITKGALQSLERYAFPGNVRELENIIQRAMIICSGDVLTADEIVLQSSYGQQMKEGKFAAGELNMTLEEVEKEYILSVLERTGWKIRGNNGAAHLLGLHPNTLRSRMAKLKIPFTHTQH